MGSAIKGGLDKDSGNCGTERKNVIMYSNLAREAEKAKQPFSLKLVGCEDGFDKCSPR